MGMKKEMSTTALRIDLHCHSNISDGSLTPDVLVMRAAQMQLDYLALTDHDAVAGVAQAQQAAADYGKGAPQILSGIELSCHWRGFEIHILGWCFQLQHEAMLQLVQQQQEKRRWRAQAIAEKLIKSGVDAEHIPQEQAGKVLTRAHFAASLMQFGYVRSVEEAFRKYLGKGQRAYVVTPWCSIEEAVTVIQQAGGSAGLAHPFAYQLKGKWLQRLLASFKAAGGDALEVASGQQEPAQRLQLAQYATDYGLAASVGSDFHFPGRWRELGRNLTLPPECIPIWQAWNLTRG